VARIRQELLDKTPIDDVLEQAIRDDHQALLRNVASADGLQSTGSQLATAHHFANVLFNNMRGGVFTANYSIQSRDFRAFVAARNRTLEFEEQTCLSELPETIGYLELLAKARGRGNGNLLRLTLEYLPLTFSRRHGDPSRPWNAFEIRVHNEDGSTIFNYQGNWRDIFQNWEALCASFPAFLPSVVAKFVNASTIDGFNPYRLSRDGIDWEVPNPEEPWSNIGYWGDHQIVYLTKLLEALHNYFPGMLEELLGEEVFSYANVPYRIKPYDQIVVDSSKTIDYDVNLARHIASRVASLGADGKLVFDADGRVYHASLMEKLLVSMLCKLSNFVLDGGIWLNTQRPEWNDANNAIVGSGLSMVTVCYLLRHVNFLMRILKRHDDRRYAISAEIVEWFQRIHTLLEENRSLLSRTRIGAEDRARVLQASGQAFTDYRLKVYEAGFTGKQALATAKIINFFQLASEYLGHSLRANRRDDHLYHAYNLLELSGDGARAEVRHLYEMLEGQVAALGSGTLDPGMAVDVINAMFNSKLFRDDQRSFMLYPERNLPGFLLRNRIAPTRVNSISLLRQLIETEDDRLIVRDVFDGYHFCHAIQKRADLEEQMARLALEERWAELVAQDRQRVRDVFEEVFGHKTYTGRSCTMYGYEGLGCIYWHMVSKLLLAVQENVFAAIDQSAPASVVDALARAYYRVRGGLSSDKTPSEYGAFPTDPYSHTPRHSGAQQPGMTGQVKEEILARYGELGVRVRDGQLLIQPQLMRRCEFLTGQAEFKYFDLLGQEQVIQLLPGCLAFSFCQVPVVCQLASDTVSVDISFTDGRRLSRRQDYLDVDLSRKLFDRTGEIVRIDVQIPEGQIFMA
jgi:hypothetical protein